MLNKKDNEIKLEALTKEDLPMLLELYRDSSFSLGYGPTENNPQSMEELLLWFQTSIKSGEEIYEAIYCKERKTGIGFIGLTDLNEAEDEGWLTMGIHPLYWGNGIGTKGLSEFIKKHASQFKRIRLSVFSTNERALALYLKQGFQLEMIYPKDKLFFNVDSDVFQLYIDLGGNEHAGECTEK